MPSPVGHSLAGLVVGHLTQLWPGRREAASGPGRRSKLGGLLFLVMLVFAANAPDLDFLPGLLIGDPDRFHHGPAHSLGAAILFGVVSGLVARLCRARHPLQVGVVMMLAFSSHLFLDMFSLDRRPPNGVPLLWPLTGHYYVVAYPLFLDVQRSPDQPSFFLSLFVVHNLRAMLWEMVVMGLALALTRLVVYGAHLLGWGRPMPAPSVPPAARELSREEALRP